jgi:tRNA-splicing ligase RtcB
MKDMFVQFAKANKVPIMIWLKSLDDIEEGCLEQANNLSNLPFVFKWVSLMPDTHEGYGMPIGGVLATRNVIIPNAVGVDIGCGMAATITNVDARMIKDELASQLVGAIMREIPVGFAHQKTKQDGGFLDEFWGHSPVDPILYPKELLFEINDNINTNSAHYQLGTLGGGNHFIELQATDDGKLAIMLHSGSRNLGKKICDYFNKVAKDLNEKYCSQVPKEWDLAFLPLTSKEGQAYKIWMDLALEFAQANRDLMMIRTMGIVEKILKKHTEVDVDFGKVINCHHNYAAIENHFGENVVVHRKGAIRARSGEIGIIPGAMGSYSYIVKGLGNRDSFQSCSHGAGRRMGRKEATRQFSVEEVINDFKAKNIVLGKPNKQDVAEEYRLAYKDIDQVLDNEKDLVAPIVKLRTLAVIKG